ncbi:AAA family ATPase [Streptomyces europaeiscabiei]|uniref:AAA family ATPase n=7 Tax=Streptomyces europaeiscabiei TaxID=146819 RepID=A0ABU4NR27_9ACTN|nr:AAA family ATPase [Streptomyces europaeiscabiei]MDX3550013.1 AAA family ATPase [Streptomyces europaeiscabiei]MDX3557420.1 AAA family ATPase [Streptomyces europaeiscabiei]MDX3672979.1 AAA family ATPase [Streptomyces europaeiscabiei]MDX3705127.1 AAA family ATPase [Streptomyces europaeiscabiei]MDX3715653.1 AAA family ATPase [Streptomyces europaeiscabiei]
MCAPEPLLERREPLELLAAEAARARTGSGRLVLLRGATGTGRTALLEAAADHAAANGMRVLRARCSPDHSSVPFGAVFQLLAHGPEFDQAAGEAPDPPGTQPHRGRPARLWRLLRSYAAESPLLVAVDDAHFADTPSRSWLVEAVRRIDRLPVLLVVTERSQYDIDPPADGLAHALSPALVHTRTLAPLSPDAGARLVRSVHGDAPPDWVDACLRACASSPLLLRALLSDLRDAAPEAFPAALPDTCAALYPGTYAAAVSWWLDSAGPATTGIARALAALDDEDAPVPADADLLARTADADPARVPGWLTAMTGLGLLRPDPDGRPRYAHPLLRDAVLGGWAGADRQAAHRRAAEAMLHRGDHVEAVAGQLLRSGPVGEAWATGALLDAADLAVRDDRGDDALACLRRALDEPMPAARRTVVLTELGSLEYATVRSTAGIPRLAEAMRLPGPPRERVHAAVALGTALARRGEARAAVDVLRGLRDEHLTGHPDLIRTVQTASALLSDHDQGVRQEVYRWLRETAERSPHLVGTAGQALLVRYEATAGLISAASAMHRVRALLAQPADPLSEVFLLGTAAAVAQWADRLDEAERLVHRGLSGQRTSLLHPMHLALLNVRIDIAAARGAHEEVLADREVSRAVAGRPESANALAHAVIALVETGRTDEAARLADAFDLQRAHDSWELNRFLYARGLLRVATGDPAAALDDFLECGRRQSARDVASPVVTPWRTAAAACHLALGRPHEALALAEQELRLATVWNTPRVLGRALSALGTATGGRRGLELGDRAVRMLRQGADGVPEEAAEAAGAAVVALGSAASGAGGRLSARGPGAAEGRWKQGGTRVTATAVHGWAPGGAPARAVGGWAVGGSSAAPSIGGWAAVEAPDGGSAGGPVGAAGGVPGGMPVDTELIPALVAQGRGLAASGERARARDAFREAAERAERLGSLRLRAVAEEALREGGARRTATAALTGPSALTAGERRIAELAAQNRTNTEIAQLLHLARRTVETHLTSTYRKLGIRRRAELGAALANPGEDT